MRLSSPRSAEVLEAVSTKACVLDYSKSDCWALGRGGYDMLSDGQGEPYNKKEGCGATLFLTELPKVQLGARTLPCGGRLGCAPHYWGRLVGSMDICGAAFGGCGAGIVYV